MVENLGDEPAPGEPDFEDVVAALLKVDPEGITGQRAKPKPKPENDEGPAPE